MIGQPALSMHEPLRFSEKLRVLAACAISVWLFRTVGGMTVQPSDPWAALSLVAHSSVLTAAVSAALLTGVVSALATVIGPSKLRGFGCFVVAVGWALLNWRADTMEYLLLYVGGSESPARSAMFGKLMLETLFWGLLAAGALVIETAVRRWLGGRRDDGADASSQDAVAARLTSGVRRAFLAVLIGSVVGALVTSQVVTGSPVAAILKGQVYFAVGLGFYLGALAALYFAFRVSPFCFVISVCLVACLSYGWAVLNPLPDLKVETYRGLVELAPTALARPLPVEYVSMGVIGALLGSWSASKVYVPPTAESQDA